MARQTQRVEDTSFLEMEEYIHMDRTSASPVTSFAEPLTLLSTPETLELSQAARIRQWQAYSSAAKITDDVTLLEQRETELLARIQTLESTNERNNETIEVLAGRLRQVEHVIGRNDSVLFQTDENSLASMPHTSTEAIEAHSEVLSTPMVKQGCGTLYGGITLPAPARPRPTAPRPRAVSITNLPSTLNSEILLRIIRGGPVQPIVTKLIAD